MLSVQCLEGPPSEVVTACSTWGPTPVAGVRYSFSTGRVVLREGVGDGGQVWELHGFPLAWKPELDETEQGPLVELRKGSESEI